MANIKKITLKDANNNSQVYSIFDNGALRLDETTKKLITGNGVVDKLVLDGDFFISEVDDVPVENTINNVMVWDSTTGQVKKRSTDKLLEDIGGVSKSMDDSTGVLTLQVGKQS